MPRRIRSSLLLAAVPPALGMGMSLLARPEIVSLVAPFFGPWAGHLYGHRDCTMARMMPVASACAVALGVLTALLFLLRRPALLRWAAALLVLTSLFWSSLAVMSVINSTE